LATLIGKPLRWNRACKGWLTVQPVRTDESKLAICAGKFFSAVDIVISSQYLVYLQFKPFKYLLNLISSISASMFAISGEDGLPCGRVFS
jgi:hypothetical protein